MSPKSKLPKGFKSPPPRGYDENPEWTEGTFARAKKPEEALSAATLKNFRGPQKTPKKVPVSIRLDEIVVRYFKREGAGWQSKINDLLVKVASGHADNDADRGDAKSGRKVSLLARAPGRRTITRTKKQA